MKRMINIIENLTKRAEYKLKNNTPTTYTQLTYAQHLIFASIEACASVTMIKFTTVLFNQCRSIITSKSLNHYIFTVTCSGLRFKMRGQNFIHVFLGKEQNLQFFARAPL